MIDSNFTYYNKEGLLLRKSRDRTSDYQWFNPCSGWSSLPNRHVISMNMAKYVIDPELVKKALYGEMTKIV